jgi:NAD-dependent deacetylase
VALTGAGISTESGIPDFRSPGTGLWNYVDPSEHLSATALRERPAEFWQIFGRVFGPVLKTQPNPGHFALSRLWSAGYLRCIVTQNIDGLHQKANCARVLEIHGHLRTARCQRCGAQFPLGPVLARLDREPIPLCPCGGYLRPDVVLFEDPMPPAFDEALAEVRAASLLLVVGSSLTVWPAGSLAYLVPHLAIINRDPTPADSTADVVVRGSAGRVLVALCAALGLEVPPGNCKQRTPGV